MDRPMMSVEDERVVRDTVPVANTLDELAAQVRPMPPPLPPPKKARLEPAGSFIRTRVSKKEKQTGKRDQFVHMIASAAASRQQLRNSGANMLTDDTVDQPPAPPTGTDTLVDDFLAAVTELTSSSNNNALTSAATSAGTKVRTSRQRARIELSEQAQFKAVLQHEAFKSDPLGALQEHLANRIRLEREQRERNAASLQTLEAHDAQASRRLHRAVKNNRRQK